MKLGEYWSRQFSVLESISKIAGIDFANRVTRNLNPREHMYSNDVYIALLEMLLKLLEKGADPETALDAVQTGWELHKILEVLNENKTFSRAAV